MNIILKQETDTGDILAGDKIYCRGMKITIFGENEIDYMYKTGLTGTDLCWIDMSNSFLYNETLAVTSPLVQHSITNNNTIIPSNVEVYLSKITTSGEIEFHIKGNYPGINLRYAYITFRYTKKINKEQLLRCSLFFIWLGRYRYI